MKLQSVLSVVLFATVAALSMGAQAADADKAAPATEMKSDKGTMAAKPHMQEKTGIPQEAPAAATPAKKEVSKSMKKHYHPRDGK